MHTYTYRYTFTYICSQSACMCIYIHYTNMYLGVYVQIYIYIIYNMCSIISDIIYGIICKLYITYITCIIKEATPKPICMYICLHIYIYKHTHSECIYTHIHIYIFITQTHVKTYICWKHLQHFPCILNVEPGTGHTTLDHPHSVPRIFSFIPGSQGRVPGRNWV